LIALASFYYQEDMVFSYGQNSLWRHLRHILGHSVSLVVAGDNKHHYLTPSLVLVAHTHKKNLLFPLSPSIKLLENIQIQTKKEKKKKNKKKK
jgi:hypothetical protein